MNNFVRNIQRWIKRDMIPKEMGEAIITKELNKNCTGYCGNCAHLEVHQEDGINIDWCPVNECRVSGFDDGCKSWLSHEEYNAVMDAMCAESEEMHIGELFMEWDKEERVIAESMKEKVEV